tara:strand:+ start:7503 stop:7889 length:387 start_codon:yes stop_codon:yes gene_type:complete
MIPKWKEILKQEVTYSVDKNNEETDIVAFLDGSKVGYINTSHKGLNPSNEYMFARFPESKGQVTIQDIHVSERARGKGVGKGLLDRLIQELPMDATNFSGKALTPEAKSFWQKMGFNVSGDTISRKIR